MPLSIIAPRPVFTPFKRCPLEDDHFSSEDVPQNPRIDLAKRPNALTNIVDQKTPQIKTQRIKPDPSDMVLTSLECRNKLKEKKDKKGTKTPEKHPNLQKKESKRPIVSLTLSGRLSRIRDTRMRIVWTIVTDS